MQLQTRSAGRARRGSRGGVSASASNERCMEIEQDALYSAVCTNDRAITFAMSNCATFPDASGSPHLDAPRGECGFAPSIGQQVLCHFDVASCRPQAWEATSSPATDCSSRILFLVRPTCVRVKAWNRTREIRGAPRVALPPALEMQMRWLDVLSGSLALGPDPQPRFQHVLEASHSPRGLVAHGSSS